MSHVCSTEERKSSLEQYKKVNDDRIVVFGVTFIHLYLQSYIHCLVQYCLIC